MPYSQLLQIVDLNILALFCFDANILPSSGHQNNIKRLNQKQTGILHLIFHRFTVV